jgi:hypothetical protein
LHFRNLQTFNAGIEAKFSEIESVELNPCARMREPARAGRSMIPVLKT